MQFDDALRSYPDFVPYKTLYFSLRYSNVTLVNFLLFEISAISRLHRQVNRLLLFLPIKDTKITKFGKYILDKNYII